MMRFGFLLILFFYCQAWALDKNKDTGFNSVELTKQTLSNTKACLNYCLEGVCIHYITHYHRVCFLNKCWNTPIIKRIEVLLSPQIRHRNPDLLVQVYDHLGDEPWTQWANVVGKNQKRSLDQFVQNLGGQALRGANYSSSYSSKQQLVLKEATIIGHPNSVMADYLSQTIKGRSWTCNQCAKESPNPSSSTPSQSDQSPNLDVSIPPLNMTDLKRYKAPRTIEEWRKSKQPKLAELDNHNDQENLIKANQIASSDDIKKRLDFNASVDQIKKISEIPRTTKNIKEDLAVMNNNVVKAKDVFSLTPSGAVLKLLEISGPVGYGLNFDRALCPSPITPLKPYYSSTNEFWKWRLGFPFVDWDHAAKILYIPKSPTDFTHALGADGVRWGNVYPRNGWGFNLNDTNNAALIAYRANSLLMEDVPSGKRVGFSVPSNKMPGNMGYQKGHDKWQLIYPPNERLNKQCLSQINVGSSGNFIKGHTEQTALNNSPWRRYAWTIWREYACCGGTNGKFLTNFKFKSIGLSSLCL